ncbi:Ack1p NDAI_0E03310 [Naumovozyma dairenensis CBS 421]|uniref:Activator of C kinase protein 1 n=1 Tax=Naumovozyma dairenensis (strain ATCC 10597 / BCRC 20456 / CBS 421 / NBRC 0211 / NRRL Y-12639) TaxID=1071378 RepID=G0WBM8_NAUDC|nr:hypothetical protein NDAI_0E03310 [Naumovozyma dairenensis CBS 421]CCD25148.1 hypothetical protein NDAI_0E03310 [Naumovozyma dairenensis CBS 421]
MYQTSYNLPKSRQGQDGEQLGQDPYQKHINLYPRQQQQMQQEQTPQRIQLQISSTDNSEQLQPKRAPYPTLEPQRQPQQQPRMVRLDSNPINDPIMNEIMKPNPPVTLQSNFSASASSLSLQLNNLTLDNNNNNNNNGNATSTSNSQRMNLPFVDTNANSRPSQTLDTKNANINNATNIKRKEECPSSPPDEYSEDAKYFFNLHKQIIQDSLNFIPNLQMKWCETLLIYAFKDDFVSNYNINAQKFTRVLKPEEILTNKKIILEHAFKLLTKLIQLKHAQAIYLMATLYSHQPYLIEIKSNLKSIITKNDAKALDYYIKASNLNHAEATYRTAICYEFQKGTPNDMLIEESLDLSFKYYLHGAQDLNLSSCKYKLGLAYLYGLNNNVLVVPLDINKAIYWFEKASTSQSCYELGKIYEFDSLPIQIRQELMSDQHEDDTKRKIRQDYKKALYYYSKCAQDESMNGFNYPLAQWKLGHCYEFGELNCSIDSKKSIAWYYKAATNKVKPNSMAMIALAGWYLTGAEGVLLPNFNESFNWIYKSYQLNDGKKLLGMNSYWVIIYLMVLVVMKINNQV